MKTVYEVECLENSATNDMRVFLVPIPRTYQQTSPNPQLYSHRSQLLPTDYSSYIDYGEFGTSYILIVHRANRVGVKPANNMFMDNLILHFQYSRRDDSIS